MCLVQSGRAPSPHVTPSWQMAEGQEMLIDKEIRIAVAPLLPLPEPSTCFIIKFHPMTQAHHLGQLRQWW